MKKWIFSVGGLSAIGLVLVLVLRSGRAEPSPRTVARPPLRRSAYWSDPEVAPGSPILLRSDSGEVRRYRFRSSHDICVDIGVGASRFLLNTDGELIVRVYEPTVHGLRFAPIHVTALGPDGSPVGDYEAMRPELERETLVRRDAEGRAVSLRFASGIGADARNFLRGLIGSIDVVVPQDGKERWVVRSEDTTGRYLAEYALRSRSDDGVRISRRKRYEELSLQGLPSTEKMFDVDTDGETAILLDPSGLLRSIEGRESLVVRGRGGQMSIHVRSESTLLVSLLDASLTVLETPDVGEIRDGFTPEGRTAMRTSVRDASVSELLTDLQRASDQGKWSEEAPRVYLTLKEIFATSAEARESARTILRSGAHPPDVLQTLADALGSTPEGWRELVPLTTDGTLDPARRLAAVSALGLSPHPPSEVIRALSDLAKLPGAESEAAVDSMGLAAGLPSNSGQREALASELAGLLGRSQDARVIQALGNAASPSTLGTILDRAGSSDVEVRSAVAAALRKYAQPEALEVAARLARDPSEEVRQNALATLARRPEPAARAVLESALRNDSNEEVRVEALQYFKSRADGKDLVLWVAKNDPSEKIRKMAAAAANR